MYGQHITISGPFASAVEKVIAALKNEGFGVLSDIDIQKAMKETVSRRRKRLKTMTDIFIGTGKGSKHRDEEEPYRA